jgi:K+-sensing histidine kinase KdpD
MMLYVLAALATIAALLLRRLLHPLLGNDNPYHALWLAVVFSAWFCGIGPSLASVVIGVVGTWYWFLPPYRSFAGKNYTEMFGMLGFLVFSAVIVALGESTRRVMAKGLRAEEELRKTQEILEERVKERTVALAQKTAETIEKAALLEWQTTQFL